MKQHSNDGAKTILEVVVGSTLHGTAVDDGLEDLDLMAVVLETTPRFIGFQPKDTWTWRSKPEGVRSEAGDVDYVAYGLRKFLGLAQRGNPSILAALFAQGEHRRVATPEGVLLQDLADHIVSAKVYEPYRGYMRQQKERLIGTRGQMNVTRPELVERYGYDTKYAGHVVRLGLQGIEMLKTGRLSLPMTEEGRTLIVDVRTGKYSFNHVLDAINEVASELDQAYLTTQLRPEPDYLRLDRWMQEVYLNWWTVKAFV